MRWGEKGQEGGRIKGQEGTRKREGGEEGRRGEKGEKG